MRHNKPRRKRFRSNDNSFRRNGSQDFGTSSINSGSKNFQRKYFGRNGFNAEKLLEKYNNLAKEALSNGDNILSESYYQHADHFLRVIENRNLMKNNSKSLLNNSPTVENSDDKVVLEDEKTLHSQEPQNAEEI